MVAQKPYNHLILTIFILLLSIPHNVFGEETKLVLNGLPSFKIEGHPDGALEQKLNDAKSHEYRVIISKIGNKYFWLSRERKELVPIQSGAYLHFISLEGSGYVKVSLLDNTYMEHVHLGLSNMIFPRNCGHTVKRHWPTPNSSPINLPRVFSKEFLK